MLTNLCEYNKFDKNNKNSIKHEEYQYLNLINDILYHGSLEEGRNGYTKFIFGAAMTFSLENNNIPLLTTKKVAWKTCLKELLWFIHGDTNNELLNKQNVNIWNGNASQEYLETRNLNYKPGDLGPIYGHQWRHFNAEYKDCDTNYEGKGVDQLANIISILKNPSTRNSRRIIMTAWNPQQLDEMALPPCHVLCQFNVTNNDTLSCSLYQRSGDVGLGVPFNIASYSFLTHLIAKHCNLKPGQFIYFLGNAHIYDDHISSLESQTLRIPYTFPTLDIINVKKDINDYNIDDFKINNYSYHESIKMSMRK